MNTLLRPEARPVELDQLTISQLRALAQLIHTLDSAVAQIPQAAIRGTESEDLDRSHASRVFFLTGEAGTGKTTLYLSLKEALRRAKISKLDVNKMPTQLAKSGAKLEKLGRQAIWLEPLGLEVIQGAGTNYLGAVLARLDQVLTARLKSHSDRTKISVFERGSLAEAMADFQRLRTNIGLAWDGNLPRRNEILDPDAHAEEVMRAESARLEVSPSFASVLQKITEELFDGENPIFILPIDDLSLNPKASLQILRLLRLISVPRLFILAMGNKEEFEELIFQELLGQIIDLAGGEAFKVERQQRVLMSRARETAFQALRKLLPPAQRCVLETMYWVEAQEVSLGKFHDSGPFGVPRGATQAGELKTLKSLLQSCRLESLDLGKRSTNFDDLFSFISHPGHSQVELSSSKLGKEDAYTGMQILEVPYRNALDLLASLGDDTDAATDKGNDWIFRWMVDQAVTALSEQNYLSHDRIEKFENAIRGTQYTSLKLNTSALKIDPDYGSEVLVASSNCQIEVRPNYRWRIYLKSEKPSQEEDIPNQAGSLSFLPPRPAAWIILLHDLLTLTPGRETAGTPLTTQWEKHEWAVTRWQPPFHTVLSSKTRSSICVRWPLPGWPSIWQLDCFLSAWRQVCENARRQKTSKANNEKTLMSLACWWITLAIDIFFDQTQARKICQDPEATKKLPKFQAELDKLYEWMDSEEARRSTSFTLQAAKCWIANLGTMAAPEFGLPNAFSTAFSNSKKILHYWRLPQVATFIRRSRARLLASFFDLEMKLKDDWNPDTARISQDQVIFGANDHPFNIVENRCLQPSLEELKMAQLAAETTAGFKESLRKARLRK